MYIVYNSMVSCLMQLEVSYKKYGANVSSGTTPATVSKVSERSTAFMFL